MEEGGGGGGGGGGTRGSGVRPSLLLEASLQAQTRRNVQLMMMLSEDGAGAGVGTGGDSDPVAYQAIQAELRSSMEELKATQHRLQLQREAEAAA